MFRHVRALSSRCSAKATLSQAAYPQRLANQGLLNIGVHGMRHTTATTPMPNNGAPIHTVANLLFRAEARTTLAVLAHGMPDDDRLYTGAMARVLFPITPPRRPSAGASRPSRKLTDSPPRPSWTPAGRGHQLRSPQPA